MTRAEAISGCGIPPMRPIIEQIAGQMRTEYEDGVMRTVQSYDFNVDKDRLSQALTDARAFYEEGYRAALREQEQREWISVKERLPDPFVSVLVYMPEERPLPTVHEGYVTHQGNWYAHFFEREPFEVTHWMPIPEPPKED